MSQLRQAAHAMFGDQLALPEGEGAPPQTRSQRTLGPSLCPEIDSGTRWCGLRPMSPDGLPAVGFAGEKVVGTRRVPIFVNAGHGALGWTLSPGCAHILASSVEQVMPAHGLKQRDLSGDLDERLTRLASGLAPGRFRWTEVLRRAVRMRLPQSLARLAPTLVKVR